MSSPSASTSAQSHPATETTPLSSAAHLQRNYLTSDISPPANDTDDAGSSDSGGGYVSGAGRRDSVLESTSRRTSRIQPSPRTTSLGHPAALAPKASNTGSLRWAALEADAGMNRSMSPDAGVSPRMVPADEPGASSRLTPSAAEVSQEDYRSGSFQTESRRRRNQQNSSKTASHLQVPDTKAKSRKQSRETLTNASLDTAQDGKSSPSWFRSVVDKYGAVELDNKGSVARDHLALERTFLAWLRTSLAFASIGIAITQLFRLNSTLNPLFPPSSPGTPSNSTSGVPVSLSTDTTPTLGRLRTVGKPLGVTFLGVSILILFMGWRRYFEAQYWIIRGKFPASRGSVFLVTLVAAALIVGSLIVVVIVGRET